MRARFGRPLMPVVFKPPAASPPSAEPSGADNSTQAPLDIVPITDENNDAVRDEDGRMIFEDG